MSQAVDAEEAVVGAMVLNMKATDFAMRELEPGDFRRPTLRVMFETISQMRSAGDPIDELLLIKRLESSKRLEEAGGKLAVLSVVERCLVTANHAGYVSEVKQAALLQMLLTTAQLMADAAHEARDSNEKDPTLKAVQSATMALALMRDRVDGRTFSKKFDLGALIDSWGGRYLVEQGDPDARLAIPFPEHLPQLNAWTMGQRPGRLIVSSGGTGHGKSWFGLDCAETVIRSGERAAYFALELPAEEVLERLIAMGGISYAMIQQREADWDSMCPRIDELGQAGELFTVLDGTTDLRRIESEIIAARSAGKPYRYVTIDTTNQVEIPGRASDETAEISKMYRRLKNLALDHRLTIHAQAQLNREWNKNRNPDDPPRMSDLKGGSSIEQNADLVLFVHRIPGVQPDTLSDVGVLVVAKGRNIRRRGRIDVQFDPSGLRFKEPANRFMSGNTQALRKVV